MCSVRVSLRQYHKYLVMSVFWGCATYPLTGHVPVTERSRLRFVRQGNVPATERLTVFGPFSACSVCALLVSVAWAGHL